MKFLLAFLLFCLLLAVAWPLAILALLLLPLAWLVALPFRLATVVVGALLAFIKAVLYLPARLLGYRG